MDGHGDAVPTVVGGHEGTAASLGDAFIERISVVFMEQAACRSRRKCCPVRPRCC